MDSCVRCKNESYYIDKLNDLAFCSTECQEAYHKFDRSLVTNLPWNKVKMDSLFSFFGSTGTVLKYLFLCEWLDVKDIRSVIMRIFIGETVAIFQSTNLVTVTNRYIYMVHGEGLISRTGDNEAAQYREEFGSISITSGHSSLFRPVRLMKRLSVRFDRQLSYLGTNCALIDIGGHVFTDERRIITDHVFYIPSDTSNVFICSNEDEETSSLHSFHRARNDHFDNVEAPGKPFIISGTIGHKALITTDGSLCVQGSNLKNRCGLGLSVAGTESFIFIETITPCIAVSCGALTTMYVSIDGSLWGTGNNSYGELGLCTITNTNDTFVRIPGLPPVCAISCGYRHSMAIAIDGSLWVTGDNVNGQLGTGDTERRRRFTHVSLPLPVMSVYCSDSISIVTLNDDSRWATGPNASNRMGIGNEIIETNSFVRLSWLPPLSSIHKKRRIEILDSV